MGEAMKNQYSLLYPVEGIGYASLIDELLCMCSYCSLVVRDFDRQNKCVKEYLRQLEMHQDNVECVSEWPGTRLTRGEVADLYWYKLSPALGSMLKMQNGLFSWLSPDTPEDLCFYRSDRSYVLASISHERDAFLDLNDSELFRLTQAIPQLHISRDQIPEAEA